MTETMHFEEQNAGEKILMVIRKHWVVYTKLSIVFFFIFVFPIIAIFFVLFSYFQDSLSANGFVMVSIFSCFYLLYGLAFLAIAWIDEAFDLFILTDERLVDITQVNFFRRMVATTPLNQIQDSTSHVGGVLQTLLGYGNIEVQTAAGSASMFFIDHVPQPDRIAHAILSEAQERGTVS